MAGAGDRTQTADVKVAQSLDFPKGSIVALDRGYIDYHLFTRWTREGVYFLSRLKTNADIQIVEKYCVPISLQLPVGRPRPGSIAALESP
jgi:hypothetical protein